MVSAYNKRNAVRWLKESEFDIALFHINLPDGNSWNLSILLFATVLIGLQILVSYCICCSIEKTGLIENLWTE